MTSGIYQLSFSDGSFYVGKSNDIERRWKEHFTKFGKGTAAAAMQAAYERCGEPACKVVLVCHEDHIDVWESYYINGNFNDSKCLNTTCPNPVNIPSSVSLNPEYLTMSMWEHITKMSDQAEEIESLKNDIESIKEGTALEEAEYEIIEYKEKITKLKEENSKLRNRGFFDYLFGRW